MPLGRSEQASVVFSVEDKASKTLFDVNKIFSASVSVLGNVTKAYRSSRKEGGTLRDSVKAMGRSYEELVGATNYVDKDSGKLGRTWGIVRGTLESLTRGIRSESKEEEALGEQTEGLKGKVEKLKDAFSGLRDRVEGAFGSLSDNSGSLLAGLTSFAAVGFALTLENELKQAGTALDTTRFKIKDLRDEAIQLRKETGISREDAVVAFEQLNELARGDAELAGQFVKRATLISRGVGLEISAAAELFDQLMRVGEFNIDQITNISAGISAIGEKSRASQEDVAGFVQEFVNAPAVFEKINKQLGTSLDIKVTESAALQFTAVQAAFKDVGIEGEQSLELLAGVLTTADEQGNTLRATIENLVPGLNLEKLVRTGRIGEAFAGISQGVARLNEENPMLLAGFQDIAAEALGIQDADFLVALASRAPKFNDALMRLNKEGLRGSAGGVDYLEERYKAITPAMERFEHQMSRLTGVLEEFGAKIADIFTPFIDSHLEPFIDKVVMKWDELKTTLTAEQIAWGGLGVALLVPLGGTILGILGSISAAILGLVQKFFLFRFIARVFAPLLGKLGFGGLAAAAKGAGAGVGGFFKTFTIGKAIMGAFKLPFKAVVGLFKLFGKASGVGTAILFVLDALPQIWDIFSSIIDLLQGDIDFSQFLTRTMSNLVRIFLDPIQDIVSALSWVTGKLGLDSITETLSGFADWSVEDFFGVARPQDLKEFEEQGGFKKGASIDDMRTQQEAVVYPGIDKGEQKQLILDFLDKRGQSLSADEFDRLHPQSKHDILKRISEQREKGEVPEAQTGGLIKRGGLVNLHAGEVVLPPEASEGFLQFGRMSQRTAVSGEMRRNNAAMQRIFSNSARRQMSPSEREEEKNFRGKLVVNTEDTASRLKKLGGWTETMLRLQGKHYPNQYRLSRRVGAQLERPLNWLRDKLPAEFGFLSDVLENNLAPGMRFLQDELSSAIGLALRGDFDALGEVLSGIYFSVKDQAMDLWSAAQDWWNDRRKGDESQPTPPDTQNNSTGSGGDQSSSTQVVGDTFVDPSTPTSYEGQDSGSSNFAQEFGQSALKSVGSNSVSNWINPNAERGVRGLGEGGQLFNPLEQENLDVVAKAGDPADLTPVERQQLENMGHNFEIRSDGSKGGFSLDEQWDRVPDSVKVGLAAAGIDIALGLLQGEDWQEALTSGSKTGLKAGLTSALTPAFAGLGPLAPFAAAVAADFATDIALGALSQPFRQSPDVARGKVLKALNQKLMAGEDILSMSDDARDKLINAVSSAGDWDLTRQTISKAFGVSEVAADSWMRAIVQESGRYKNDRNLRDSIRADFREAYEESRAGKGELGTERSFREVYSGIQDAIRESRAAGSGEMLLGAPDLFKGIDLGGIFSLTGLQTVEKEEDEEVQSAQTGGYVTKEGLVNLHAGEVILPSEVANKFMDMEAMNLVPNQMAPTRPQGDKPSGPIETDVDLTTTEEYLRQIRDEQRRARRKNVLLDRAEGLVT